jgi:hypothetical protein
VTTAEVRPRTSSGWRLVRFLTAVAALVTVPYLAGVLLPYYVNGLHELPLAEVASGRHDPKDLWPQGFVGGLIQLGGFLGLALTPLGLVFVGGTSAALSIHGLLSRGLPRAAAAALVVLAVACAVGLAWFLGDTSQALTTWRLD